jgi:hypothetical protein
LMLSACTPLDGDEALSAVVGALFSSPFTVKSHLIGSSVLLVALLSSGVSKSTTAGAGSVAALERVTVLVLADAVVVGLIGCSVLGVGVAFEGLGEEESMRPILTVKRVHVSWLKRGCELFLTRKDVFRELLERL